MRYFTVDLYDYFGKERKEESAGKLTCYLPNISQMREKLVYPAVMISPGGAYVFVSSREGEPIALRYLAQGFAVFVLEYAVWPAKYPLAFIEAAMAMAYIRANCEELRVDPSRIAAAGFSAGGHLCGCLATLFDEEILKEELGDYASQVRPDAAVLAYPVISSNENSHQASFNSICGDDIELKKKLSLETRVTKDASPAFIWHTFDDEQVSVENSLLLATAYKKAGVPFSLHVFEKGSHGLATADDTVFSVDDMPEFSKGVLNWIDMSIDWLKERGIRIKD